MDVASAQTDFDMPEYYQQPKSGNLRSSSSSVGAVTVSVPNADDENNQDEEEAKRNAELEEYGSTTTLSINIGGAAEAPAEKEEETETETETEGTEETETTEGEGAEGAPGNSGNTPGGGDNNGNGPPATPGNTNPEDDGEINVMIIGSAVDMGSYGRTYTGETTAFNPTMIRDFLQVILENAFPPESVEVNVVLEDRYRRYAFQECYNTAHWYHWPNAFPNTEDTKENRWANLRNEGATTWDYIVLIGDSYTIENQPGLFTYGAGKIYEEIQRTNTSAGIPKAELVLLQTWPDDGDEDKMDWYREVIYRTGRSAGLKVAPGGLAWLEAGEPGGYDGGNTGLLFPTPDGAYIAASSIFSRIFEQSAATPSNQYDMNGLADLVYEVVVENIGKPQYDATQPFEMENAYTPWVIKDRHVKPGKTGGGSSTEEDLMYMGRLAAHRTGVHTHSSGHGQTYLVGRDSGGPTNNKDYRRNGFDKRVFGYYYQVEGNGSEDDQHISGITYYDFAVAHRMPSESPTFRIIPRRLLFAAVQRLLPAESAMGTHGHMGGASSMACGSYIHTILTDRTPVTIPSSFKEQEGGGDPQVVATKALTPSGETYDDNEYHEYVINKVAYETAWQVSHLQIRAPGLQALPSSENKLSMFPGETGEIMTVRFINPPQQDVTVEVSIDDNDPIAELTFTSQNYNIAQQVTIDAQYGHENGDILRVHYVTKSDDEVFNALHDLWDYQISS